MSQGSNDTSTEKDSSKVGHLHIPVPVELRVTDPQTQPPYTDIELCQCASSAPALSRPVFPPAASHPLTCDDHIPRQDLHLADGRPLQVCSRQGPAPHLQRRIPAVRVLLRLGDENALRAPEDSQPAVALLEGRGRGGRGRKGKEGRKAVRGP